MTGSLTLDTTLLGPLTIPDGAGREAELLELAARVTHYATRARGEGTRRAYRSAWQGFVRWCHALGREPLAGDAETIAMYLVRRADDGRAVSSMRVDLAAIRTAHLLAGIPLDLRQPRLAMVMQGVTRSHGLRPRRKAAPAVPDLLRAMLAAPGMDPKAAPPARAALVIRDRAMLLLGFGAALRRSELTGLAVGDIAFIPGRGVTVLVRRSKTDQQGRGQEIAVWANTADPDFCPVEALRAWLALRQAPQAGAALFCAITKGGRLTGVGLSDKAVARLVKQAAAGAGLDATAFSGHSLRAGLMTAAAEAGAELADLMRQSRHRSADVALGYLRPADLWRNNVTARVFAPPAVGGQAKGGGIGSR